MHRYLLNKISRKKYQFLIYTDGNCRNRKIGITIIKFNIIWNVFLSLIYL